MAQTPQRFVQRAGSGMPGRMRRAIDGALESKQRNGNTVEVAADGRLEVKVPRGGGLKLSADGLMIDQDVIGEKNRPKLNLIRDAQSVSTNATLQGVVDKINEILAELRRTGNMRG